MIYPHYYVYFIIFTIAIFPANIGSIQFPIAKPQDNKFNVVIIDAGHGGKDPGTIGLTGTHEKIINLNIAKRLKVLLEKNYSDLKVIMTRNDDSFIELKRRGEIANENKGKLFVSIHCNAKKAEENDKNGFEIYILDNYRVNEAINIAQHQNLILQEQIKTGNDYVISSIAESSYLRNSERFSSIIQTEMIKGTTLETRGIYSAGFLVLVGASMPCVLVECGYLSNVRDEIYLKSEKGQNEIANSIYKAIRLYKFDYDFENSF